MNSARPTLNNIKNFWKKGLTSLVLVGGLVSVVGLQPAAVEAWPWPQLITKNDLFHITDQAMIVELSKYDIVILNLDIWRNSPEAVDELLSLNPDIKLLANLQISEIDATWKEDSEFNYFSHRFYAGIDNSWWLRNTQGQQIYFYTEQFPMLNLTKYSPKDATGRTWSDWFVEYSSNLLENPHFAGRIHGLFLDVAIDEMSWYTDYGQWDIDNNSLGDDPKLVDKAWKEGLHDTVKKLRLRIGPDIILLANGQNTTWDWANGQLDEDFDTRFIDGKSGFDASHKFMLEWKKKIKHEPTTNVLWSYGTSNTDWRSMRYGLTSAGMFDAYFGWGVKNAAAHYTPIWFDEYNADLGMPINNAKKLSEGAWRKDFERGAILVNPTNRNKQISLGGEFIKINGTQDSIINNGEQVSSINLPAKDGIVLLKIN